MFSEKALTNRTRKMVYSYISRHPGVSFGTIMGVLDLTEGTLRYHLNYLERGDKILSESKGKHRYYYHSDRRPTFPTFLLLSYQTIPTLPRGSEGGQGQTAILVVKPQVQKPS